jgi:hypothetical protein
MGLIRYKTNNSIMSGKTQKEHQNIINILDKRYPFSLHLDADSFDQRLPSVCISIFFKTFETLLCKTHKSVFMIRQLLVIEARLGVFHKTFGYHVLSRARGILSGSQFTSVIGSFSTIFMAMTTLVSAYGKIVDKTSVYILANGDDLLIYSDFYIDSSVFVKQSFDLFGVVYSSEQNCEQSGRNKIVSFSGST